MNKEEILAMPAGMELNAVIAEKVMGWTLPPYSSVVGQMWVEFTSVMVHPEGLHNWSTDISAAFEIIDKLKEKYRFDIVIDKEYSVSIMDYDGYLVEAEAMNAPEAICKAALLAVMDS